MNILKWYCKQRGINYKNIDEETTNAIDNYIFNILNNREKLEEQKQEEEIKKQIKKDIEEIIQEINKKRLKTAFTIVSYYLTQIYKQIQQNH